MSTNARTSAVKATFAAWRERAARVGGRDTMLHFRDSRDGSIDLSGAHPSGLAQLLAGRATRLSSLIRDPEHIGDAYRRAQSIRQKAVQLSYERGIHTAHLAIGFATWTRDIDSVRTDYSAPILLRHVTLVPRGSGGEDFEVVLSDDIVLNPALVEYLATEHRVDIDVDEWIAATGYSQGFDPAPVLDRLRQATRTVPGFLVNQRLVISTFANIATPFTRKEFPVEHPILRALAGDAQARAELAGRTQPQAEDDLVRTADSDPAEALATDNDSGTETGAGLHATPGAGAKEPTASSTGENTAAETDGVEAAAKQDEADKGDGEPAAGEKVRLQAGATDDNAPKLGEAAGLKSAEDSNSSQDTTLATKTSESSTPEQLPERTVPVPVPERAPQEEFLVIDVDGDQQAVVDAALTGDSFVVDTPPGTGATQAAVALAATLAHIGRSVLYVAQSSDALDDFAARMEQAGLGDFAVDGRDRETELKKKLIALIVDAERAAKPELMELVTQLNHLREAMMQHTQTMQRVRQPWNSSVYSTMEKLAALTAAEDGPMTSVRFEQRVMNLTAQERENLRTRLIELSELGAFTLDVEDTVWFGAKFVNDKQAESARAAAERAARLVPELVDKVEPVLREAGMNPPRSVGGWGVCLELLMATKQTLEDLVPAVYTADLDALIAATGTGEYRRRNRIEQSVFERGKLKRQARELLRDTSQTEELHVQLARARDEREEWREHAGNHKPHVPAGTREAHELFTKLDKYLAELTSVLVDTPDGGDLDAMLIEELQARLEALGRDRAALADLPTRTKLDASLRQEGLGDLLDDLRHRRVRHSQVGQEFDLAYWATVLQHIATEDHLIKSHNGAELHQIATDYCAADRAFVKAGASRLRYSHATHWRKAIADHKLEAEALRNGLKAQHLHVEELSVQAPHVLAALAPVWMMSPFDVPSYFAEGEFFDTVIVADSARMSVPEVLPALARARQVIALGDARLPGPREFSVAVNRHAEPKESETDSLFSELAKFLTVRGLHNSHRIAPRGLVDVANRFFYDSSIESVPTALTTEGSGLEFAFVPDALGAPDSATGQVESPEQEVSKVVELVLRHARTKTRQSLAVITLTPWHASRVAAAIQQAIRAYPYVASFFTDSSKEPFVVTDVEKVQGIARDAVIFSIGYGRSLQGRVLYKFGVLDKPGSERLLAAVVTRARRKLTVVSGFEAGDFDRARVHHGAALLPDLLEVVAAGNRAGTGEHSGTNSEADPLVADIAQRLVRRGLSPVIGYGGIDLAVPVAKSEEQGMALAIETDGRRYTDIPSVRERVRLRPEALARRGWNFCRMWAMDAFVDPQEQTERIFQQWKQTVEARSPQAVLDAARAAAVVTHRQGSRPKVTPGLPLHTYSENDLDAMVAWIQSDGVFRDDAELAQQLCQALATRARTPDLSDVVGRAIKRYRAAAETGLGQQHGDEAEGQATAQPLAGESAQPAEVQARADTGDSRPGEVPQGDVMPGYDTGMLRAEELIDAGLRKDEDEATDDDT